MLRIAVLSMVLSASTVHAAPVPTHLFPKRHEWRVGAVVTLPRSGDRWEVVESLDNSYRCRTADGYYCWFPDYLMKYALEVNPQETVK